MLIALELSLLALIAWPVLRATFHPALRRAFSRTAAAMAFVVLVGSASVVGIALWSPRLLHLITLIAVGVTLIALVRTRRDYGRAQRLPPGSLSWLPFDYLIDPFFFQRCFERHGDIFKVNQFGVGAGPNPLRGVLQPVCCVDLKRGIKILHEHDERLTPPPIPSSRFIPKKYLREMAHDDHRHYRRIFSTAFVPQVIDESTPFIAQHFRKSLLDMADQSAANGSRGAAPEPMLLAMTFGVFARCFLGIVPSDARFRRVRELIDVIDLANRNDREVTVALDDIAAILRQEAQRAIDGAERLPRSFLGEIASREPQALEDLTALRNFIYIMQASWIDAAGLMVWLFKELSDHPEWRERLSTSMRAGIADGCESVSIRCVKETLRLRQSEYLYRKALEDVAIDGFIIPKGWLLRVCIRESHRDGRIFADPHTFNPDRFLDARYTREEYATFGASRISCLGEHLTLVLGRIFVEEFATTVETIKLRDGPLEYRRWHWKPSSRWRVSVRRVDRATASSAGCAGT